MYEGQLMGWLEEGAFHWLACECRLSKDEHSQESEDACGLDTELLQWKFSSEGKAVKTKAYAWHIFIGKASPCRCPAQPKP